MNQAAGRALLAACPEDRTLQNHRSENLKSFTVVDCKAHSGVHIYVRVLFRTGETLQSYVISRHSCCSPAPVLTFIISLIWWDATRSRTLETIAQFCSTLTVCWRILCSVLICNSFSVPSELRACAGAQRPSHSRALLTTTQCFFFVILVWTLQWISRVWFLIFYLMSVMDLFFNSSSPPPPRAAQVNPIAAQKTPWLAHLHPRLRGNVE
jgi:hypothetical protein